MRLPIIAMAIAGTALLLPTASLAHCDGLDGPVVGAARKALESGDPNLVLIWVQPKDELEIRRSFNEAVAVRRLSPQAREMADRYFFETLVRLHRAGEGAAYTGLKPAGRDLGPAIPLADRAIVSGSEHELTAFLTKEVEKGVHQRFANLQAKRKFQSADLAAGRAYVGSYVTFIHYAEGLYQAAESRADGHYEDENVASPEHQD
jgi:hypothetical protein